MTDDLDMGAILTGYRLEETIRLAVAAGNDLTMICHRIPEIENVYRILGALPRGQIDRALANVARFKEKLTPPDDFSEAAFRDIDSEIWDLRVAVLGEELARQRSQKMPNARQLRCTNRPRCFSSTRSQIATRSSPRTAAGLEYSARTNCPS